MLDEADDTSDPADCGCGVAMFACGPFESCFEIDGMKPDVFKGDIARLLLPCCVSDCGRSVIPCDVTDSASSFIESMSVNVIES